MKDKKSPSQQKPLITIDWADLRRRLENTQTTMEQGLTLTPERKREILKTRAKTLAREPEIGEGTQGDLEIVEFLLSYETYGIESSFVREVYPLNEITPLPGTSPFVLGIINVRGQILSVLDLKKFFDLPEKGLSDLNKVIIIHDEIMEFGILADAVTGIRKISLDIIQPALPTLTGIRAEYLKGVTDKREVILDAKKILRDEKIIVT
jgi:purine-binding chemotaxis protein CheW